MNIDTTVIAAAPLVTEHPWALSPGALIGLGMSLIGVVFSVVVVVASMRSESDEVGLLPFAIVIAAFSCIGLLLVAEESEGGGRELDASSVNEAISEQYRITSIEPAAEENEDEPTAAQLCEPVSTKSAEYIGVADGQQIRFKAGSTNCTSDNPDITIIVTDTPGAALSADDLRKRTTTEEP